jgi:inhibitor of KinA sporulation pathway (predicted exonuclease)
MTAQSPSSRTRLLAAFRDYSEDRYAAGWMSGLSFHLWDRLTEPSASDDIELQELRLLGWQAGGWYDWDEARGRPVFLTMSRWAVKYAEVTGKPLPPIHGLAAGKRPRLDRVLVLDLEATCWDGPAPDGQTSEIIEIGVCPWDAGTGRIGPAESILVRPRRSTVSEFCTQLTTLTQKQVDAGMSLPGALKRLAQVHGPASRPWASWGAWDERMLRHQCHLEGAAYPFRSDHFNVKTLHALATRQAKPLGLGGALRAMGLAFEGTPHRAGDDAYNVARILAALLEAKNQA